MRKPRPQDYAPTYQDKGPQPEEIDMEGVVAIKPKPSTTPIQDAHEDDQTERPERAVGPVRPVRPVRPERVSDKREIRRHSFEFYRDQLQQLDELRLKHMRSGELKSKSAMVREALDKYLERQ